MTQNSFFAEIQEQFDQKRPLVVYRKPGKFGVRAFLQKDSSIFKSIDLTESGFVLFPFDDQKDSFLIPREHSRMIELEKFEPASKGQESGSPKISEDSFVTSNSAVKEDHLRLIEKALEKLNAGDMEKVVLSRQEKVELRKEEPLEIFKDLLEGYPDAFVYFWHHPATGIWVGATPETLVRAEGLNFSTMALAGTQKFTGKMDVNWGEKEKLEQKYVTDAILNDLDELKVVEELKISDTFTSRAGGVLHLRTDITGKIRSAEKLEEIIRSLHPTPAVCGSPMNKAKDFILTEEGYDREYYTGFLGELNLQEKSVRSRNRRNTENLAYATVRKRSALFVNLRCMKLEEHQAIIFVGGGITKDSVPEDEYLETQNKAQTMKKVLGKYI